MTGISININIDSDNASAMENPHSEIAHIKQRIDAVLDAMFFPEWTLLVDHPVLDINGNTVGFIQVMWSPEKEEEDDA